MGGRVAGVTDVQMFQEKHMRSEDKRSGLALWVSGPGSQGRTQDLSRSSSGWVKFQRERRPPMCTEECGARPGRGRNLGKRCSLKAAVNSRLIEPPGVLLKCRF